MGPVRLQRDFSLLIPPALGMLCLSGLRATITISASGKCVQASKALAAAGCQVPHFNSLKVF